MIYLKLNLMRELRQMAKGKPTKLPAEQIAQWALDTWANTSEVRSPKNDEVAFLNGLHALPDLRT